jgi:hypothetical protein
VIPKASCTLASAAFHQQGNDMSDSDTLINSVVKFLDVLTNPHANYYLFDDGFCKSRELARDAQIAVSRIEEIERELAAERKKSESLRAQLHGMQDGALLRDTQAALAAARKRNDESTRRLQHMHSAHCDSVQWYQNAVAQALKSMDALPDKLDFEEK